MHWTCVCQLRQGSGYLFGMGRTYVLRMPRALEYSASAVPHTCLRHVKYVPWLNNGCASDVPRTCHVHASDLPRVCLRSASDEPRMCNGCVSGVLWECRGYAFALLLALWECNTAAGLSHNRHAKPNAGSRSWTWALQLCLFVHDPDLFE